MAGVAYTHTDMLGSPVARSQGVAGGGSITNTRFEPYGAVAQGFTPNQPYVSGFTGHVQDGRSGLVYMQQRYYDPIAARFLSEDPVVTDVATGKQFGRYTYVDNNPYSKTDPDGRIAIADDVVIGAGVLIVGCAMSPGGRGAISDALSGAANALGNLLKSDDNKEPVATPATPGSPGSDKGCVYCVPGDKTSSGKDYIGRSDNFDQRKGDKSDGRDRNDADIVGSYPKGDKRAGAEAEQQEINNRGGVGNLDNKRNEIAEKKWGDRGVKPPKPPEQKKEN